MGKTSDDSEKKVTSGVKAFNSSETTSDQQIPKYHTGAEGRTGHGYAAEDVNVTFDKLKGKKVEKVGTDNKKNGADRIVNGQQIQSKYCKTAKRTIDAAFGEDGIFRYKVRNGKPMRLEVPRDQYDEVVELMRQKIIDKKVKGVTNPVFASKMVKKGLLTYKQSKMVAKFGNIYSITYDAATESINCASAFGLSAVIAFFIAKKEGISNKEAMKLAAKKGGWSAVEQVVIGTTTKQILRVTTKNATKQIVTANAKKMVERSAKKAIEQGSRRSVGTMAKVAAKGNVVTVIVTTAVVTVPDIYKAAKGKITWEECRDKAACNAGSVTGGMVGAAKGAALGMMCGPAAPVTTPLFALISGFGGGWLGDYGAKKMLNWFKSTKKKIAKGGYPVDRIEKFNHLLEVADKYRRLNQYV